MAIQFLRRTGAGAPSALKSGQPAWSDGDSALRIGAGDDGGGNATSIQDIAGPGVTVMLSGAQTVAGVKTFSSPPVVPTPVSPTDAVNKAYADSLSGPSLTAGSGIDATDLAANTVTVDTTVARLAGPAFTGTPTAPTAASGANTTQLATTAFVASAISDVLNGAPGALDTLNELAAALGNDANFATTVTNGLAGKLNVADNLSDLNDASIARTNLGLGTLALQAAASVAITGGTISGVQITASDFDDGTY